MNRRHFITAMLVTGAAATVGGCVVYPGPDDYGPPAYGYRYHHPYGVDLDYDAGLGVYTVVGWPNYYFWDNRFYRFRRDRWEESPRFRGGWHGYDHDRLPRGLGRSHSHGRSRDWDRGRGRH